MRRANVIPIAFAAIALAFFAAPAAARLLGVTAEAFENRKLAAAPTFSQGWDAFQQTTRYLTDHLPLRAEAVRTNTRIWRDVFGTDPRYGDLARHDEALPFAEIRDDDSERPGRNWLQRPANVTTGLKGWLFVGGEVQAACSSDPPDTVVLEKWASLVRATRSTGRGAIALAVPHKASVYPEYLPADTPRRDCALRAKDRFWSLLSEKGPPLGVHELRSELVRLKEDFGDELFEVTDMHWSTLGALTMVDAALDEFGNGIRVAPNEVKKLDKASYTGDLSALSGDPAPARHAEYDVVRAPTAAKVPGRTVLIGDSFGFNKAFLLFPYFEDFGVVSIYDGDKIVKAIRKADRVIFVAVETNMRDYAPGIEGLVDALSSP